MQMYVDSEKGPSMKINKFFSILLITFISCSASMVGKQMPPAKYAEVKPNLQYIDLRLIEIELTTETDLRANTMTAKGKIAVVQDELPPGLSDFKSVNIKAFLMDENYTIVREISFNAPAGANRYAPIPYKVTFPYDPAYRYMYIKGGIHYWN